MTLNITLNDRTKNSALQRQKVMDDSIKIMAALIEKRDPYTSRHQIRVAKLACTIASEMHFTQDQILGLNLASGIHDIGKMLIPFEILSKPGKLNCMEYNIIKEHPGIAGDILANMEYHWPISHIVYQHHERLDGSGYPAGLKGEVILPEAKVLAVADVIEAMAFDRPYRPALGMATALDEITQRRGMLYDVEAVDACLKLFNEKGFKFEECNQGQ